MPVLNKEKCFAQQAVRLTVEVPAQLPNNWLDSLCQLAAKQLGLAAGDSQTSFISDIKKHGREHTLQVVH